MARGGGFGQGFLMGTQAAKGLLDLYNQANQQNEREVIANAKPEVMQGYTAQQGADLSAAAASGQYDIGVKTKDDGTFDSYTVTPKADPSQTGVIAQQGVTDFMGNRSAGTMTDDQVNRARTMAMAGVVAKTNPIEGLRMQQAVKAGERDDKLFDVQMDRADREKRKADDEDAFNAARRNAYGQSIHGRNMNKYVQDYQAWEQGGKQADAPTMPTYSLAQSLADTGTMLSIDAQYGKADPKALQQYAATMKQVRDEGYGAALKVAQSGGSAAQTAEAFNKSGTMKVEPGAIQVTRGKGADGMPTTTLAIRDAQGKVQTINVLAELDALGQADKIFDRFYRAEDNRRGNAQLALAQNRDARDAAATTRVDEDRKQTRDDAEAKADAAVALFKERNPKATQAEVDAVRKGILAPLPTADKNAPAEVKLAKAMLDAGLVPNMQAGLERALSSKSKSPRDAYLELSKPQGGIQPNPQQVETVMQAAFGNDWKQKVGGEGGGKPTIESDPRAIAIRDNPNLSIEQKRAELAKLGYK